MRITDRKMAQLLPGRLTGLWTLRVGFGLIGMILTAHLLRVSQFARSAVRISDTTATMANAFVVFGVLATGVAFMGAYLTAADLDERERTTEASR